MSPTFSSLPAELRSHIFSLCLASDTTTLHMREGDDLVATSLPSSLSLNTLLSLCRESRAEALKREFVQYPILLPGDVHRDVWIAKDRKSTIRLFFYDDDAAESSDVVRDGGPRETLSPLLLSSSRLGQDSEEKATEETSPLSLSSLSDKRRGEPGKKNLSISWTELYIVLGDALLDAKALEIEHAQPNRLARLFMLPEAELVAVGQSCVEEGTWSNDILASDRTTRENLTEGFRLVVNGREEFVVRERKGRGFAGEEWASRELVRVGEEEVDGDESGVEEEEKVVKGREGLSEEALGKCGQEEWARKREGETKNEGKVRRSLATVEKWMKSL